MSPAALIELASRFAVTDARKFRLDKVKTDDTRGFAATKDEADDLLRKAVARIAAHQETLYAQNRWGVLLIFQAMDAAGKDSAIEHVFSGVNPQGVQVFSFKAPSSEELDHDFLWRTTVRLPERGRIGVFNRSYYEEVLVVRVHPELLEHQGLPKDRIRPAIWRERFEDINAFERHLWRSGTTVVKLFLNISRGEQERRLLARIDDPSKNWKFAPGDLRERARWREYLAAYAEALSATSTAHAPWYVIPADHKWFAHAAIAEILYDTLRRFDLRFPSLTRAQRRELAQARRQLTRKGTRRP